MNHSNIWIKICGNTSLADARLAADAGADAVGFVFAPSPRRVTPAQVAAIVPHLPPALEKIGVFVDLSFDEIAAIVEAGSLTGVQLHWNAPPDLPAALRSRFGPRLRILRVVHFAPRVVAEVSGLVSGHELSRAANSTRGERALAPEEFFDDPSIDAILVDNHSTKAVGGTGQTFDWALASTTFFQDPRARKRIAAGGLTPENVATAIATLHPWGVDVASGVEAAPGRKDPAKVRAFIANARAVQS